MTHKTLPLSKLSQYHSDIIPMMPEDAVLERVAHAAEFKAEAGEPGTVTAEAVFSASVTDSDGDLVYTGGVNADFWNGCVLWNHSFSTPAVAEGEITEQTGSVLKGRLKMSQASELSRDLSRLLAEGMLRSVSIGFVPRSVLIRGTQAFADFAAEKLRGVDLTQCRRIIASSYLVEVSLCNVGVCRAALVTAVAMKSLDLDPGTQALMGMDPDVTEALSGLFARTQELERQVLNLQAAKAEPVNPEPVEEPVNPEPISGLKGKVISRPIPDHVVKSMAAGRLV